MKQIKDKMYKQLFEEYKESSNLDELSKKYIFETWKMIREIHEKLHSNQK